MVALRHRVSEIIGRIAPATRFWRNSTVVTETVDKTVTDYAFWDKLRRGKQPGFEFSGLFVQAISKIMVAWTLGKGVQAELVDSKSAAESSTQAYTNTLLKRFLTRIHSLLLQMFEDLDSLGDQFVIVNPDASISIPSPDTVDMVYDDFDYRTPIRCTITTKTDKRTVIDEYRLDGRTITVKWNGTEKELAHDEIFQFQNLIGTIPVIHFPNQASANETHGRPTAEPLYHLLSEYNDLVVKNIDGAKLMGNPFPVIEGVEDPDETIENNGEQVEERDSDGSMVNRWRINFFKLTMLVLGKGGSFKFATPPRGFTEDVKGVCKLLFLLLLDFTRIPEVIWGNELSSARASAEEQMKTFYMHIEGRRVALEGLGADDLLEAEARGGMFQLIDIWLRTKRLTDRRIVVAPVILKWPDLSEADGKLTLEWTKWLYSTGLIREVSAVAQSGRYEDPAEEVEGAKVEVAARKEQFDQAVEDELKKADNADEGDNADDSEDKAAAA